MGVNDMIRSERCFRPRMEKGTKVPVGLKFCDSSQASELLVVNSHCCLSGSLGSIGSDSPVPGESSD